MSWPFCCRIRIPPRKNATKNTITMFTKHINIQKHTARFGDVALGLKKNL